MLKGRRFSPAMIVAMIALAVALSGTAVAGTTKLITGSQIANGTIKLADIHSSAKTALKGQTGATGAQGPAVPRVPRGRSGRRAPPARRATRASRATRVRSALPARRVSRVRNGANGKDGRDGVRWERVAGNCSSGAAGEVVVIDSALKFNLPDHNSYAQFKMLVENMTLADVNKLSLRVNMPDVDGFYLKLKLEGDKFVVFSAGSQGGMQTTDEWVTYDIVGGSIVRDHRCWPAHAHVR